MTSTVKPLLLVGHVYSRYEYHASRKLRHLSNCNFRANYYEIRRIMKSDFSKQDKFHLINAIKGINANYDVHRFVPIVGVLKGSYAI